MSNEVVAIIAVGIVVGVLQLIIVFEQSKANEHLAETNRRLQIFWEEWVQDRPTRR